MSRLSKLEVFNLQNECRVSTRKLARRLQSSLEFLPKSRKNGKGKSAGKPQLLLPLPEYIEISLVTSQVIGEVHAEFLDDPTPTDVITFDHGEILVCPAVAQVQGKLYGRTLDEEVLLYGIHGLLHLQGWSDKTTPLREAMARVQEKVWRQVLKLDLEKSSGK